MKTTHYFDTANADNLNIAERAALKAGLSFYKELRPTCIKKYHFEVTATTPAKDAILTLIILATTAHPEQPEYKRKLAERIAEM